MCQKNFNYLKLTKKHWDFWDSTALFKTGTQ